jgi:hypothetical protein
MGRDAPFVVTKTESVIGGPTDRYGVIRKSFAETSARACQMRKGGNH